MAAAGIPDEEALELVELLCFVAELCAAQHRVVSDALSHFVGVDYDATQLGDDAARLAGVVARALGCAELVGP